MRRYNIKDIVKIRGITDTLYMVVDYNDFTDYKNGGTIDIDYELVQILPVQRTFTYRLESQDDIEIHTEANTNNFGVSMGFVHRARESVGLFGEPDYIKIAEKNMLLDRTKTHDVVRYDLFATVDECLDAINDLNELHRLFKDETYIRSKELVVARIAELQK